MPAAPLLMSRLACACLLLLLSWPAPAIADEPELERIECPAVADTTIFTHGQARDFNAGALASLQFQANGRFAIMKFDTSRLAGREVVKATLRLQRREELLVRVGVGTVSADWAEGDAAEPKAAEGGACYEFAAYAKVRQNARPWAWPGSDFSDVSFGNGGSRWAAATATVDKQGQYQIELPPALVQALAQGLQPGGLCLADEFHREPLPTVNAHEIAEGPLLVVEARPVALRSSAPPRAMRTYRDDLGIEWVEFEAPQALGFEVALTDVAPGAEGSVGQARRLDSWALPSPGPGKLRAMLSYYRRSTDHQVAVRCMDPAAGWSEWAAAALPPPLAGGAVALAAPLLPRFDLPRAFDRPFVLDDGPALSLDGRWIRSAAKTWFDPFRGPVTLQAARNEFVAFQVMLCGASGEYQVTLADWQPPGTAAPAPQVRLYRQHYVRARLGDEKFAPEIAAPLERGTVLPLTFDQWQPDAAPAAPSPADPPATAPATQPASQPQGPTPLKRTFVQGIWVEIHVPHATAPGIWRNRAVVVHNGAAVLDVPLELEVTAAALPDRLSFPVCLGTQVPLGDPQPAGAAAGRFDPLHEAYRLAHRHRVTLAYNPVRYDGRIESGFAPEIKAVGEAATLDFDDWDRRFGRYFDGSAFRDLPREGAPLDFFFLPLSQNWPLLMQPRVAPQSAAWRDKYSYRATWADRRNVLVHRNPPAASYTPWPIEESFVPDYAAQIERMTGQFAAHLRERNWSTTFGILPLQRLSGVREGSWWNLEMPATVDDYLALRYWLRLFRQGGAGPGGPIRLWAALSEPQFGRGILDGLLDFTIMDMSFLAKQWHVLTNRERYGQVWSSNWPIDPEYGWSSIYRWAWTTRIAGASGLALRESIGETWGWSDAVTEALMYPAEPAVPARLPPKGTPRAPLQGGLTASLRLKALLRAQQDMELIHLWQQRCGDQAPAGFLLSTLGTELMQRMNVRPPQMVHLLPVFEMPGQLDTVVFEELRRGLRAAAVSGQP